MPVCPQCDNRQFTNKEALLQHMRTSSAPHPFCAHCDRRFVSQTAYDAHMAAKHPPTYDCTLCNRPYHAPFALEDHYRGSNLHPNCTKCGRGFRDQAACDEHRLTMHPKSACAPCGGKVFYDDELPAHYWDSPNHPKCQVCKTGCKDDALYQEHISTAHLDQYCTICTTIFDTTDALKEHYWASSLHPKCERCGVGFLNSEMKGVHMETHTQNDDISRPSEPEIIEVTGLPQSTTPAGVSLLHERNPVPQAISLQRSDASFYNTGFTPLSPRNHIQNLILGERRVNTPEIHLDYNYSPIIEAKPPFSPSLPRPGLKIEEIWSSTQNVQVSPTRTQKPPSPPRTVESYLSRPIGYLRYPRASTSGSSSSWGSSFSPPRSEFDPRLYPGSVRAGSVNRQGLLTEVNMPFSGLSRTFPPGPASVSGGTSYGRPQFSRGRTASTEIINWEDLMGTPTFDNARFSAADAPSPTTAVCSSPSPRVLGGEQLSVVPQPHPLVHSPSLATVSSPASSALGNSPIGSGAYDADTRPTTASSTPSYAPMRELTYNVTPISECPMDAPPYLDSPIGLHSLPAMSPLAGTPVDLVSYDIPAARRPLPDSPVEGLSPVTVVVELPHARASDEHASAHEADERASPLSTTSARSYTTSPQEPEPSVEESASPRAMRPRTPAPATLHKHRHTPPLPHQLDTAELERAFDLVPQLGDESDAGALDRFVDTVVASPVTPVGSARPEPAAAEAVTARKTAPPNPLHCRACLADTCDDITASMCGHIFCNRCITDAVIKTSRCPVCMTPTLLYCLFRLDIAA